MPSIPVDYDARAQELRLSVFLYEIHDWDERLVKRLYKKHPDQYECAYLYMFTGNYNPNHFIKTLQMKLA